MVKARGRGNGAGTSYQQTRDCKRQARMRGNHRVKLRDTIGVIGTKHSLKIGMLNVDGLSPSSLEDVRSACARKTLDVCVLLETHRRHEELGDDVAIAGYDLHEVRRSDVAGDRGGGGLAFYTRQADGILFKEYSPPVADPGLHYVRNERFWLTTESLLMKTALCGVYLACQHGDDRFASWNDGLLLTLRSEAAALRSKGYRIVFVGDFNAHIGSMPGRGILGNHPDVNHNGERFLRFLEEGSFRHVNGERELVTGLWTRQRGGSKTILDYAVISSEHIGSVESLFLDDHGQYAGSSDHNFLFLVLNDQFVQKRRLLRIPTRKRSWNNMDNMDWGPFQVAVAERLATRSHGGMSVDEMASFVTSALLAAGERCVGRRRPSGNKGPLLFPRAVVEEVELKRTLEAEWKTLVAEGVASVEVLVESESAFTEQKQRTDELIFAYKNRDRPRIRELCAGTSSHARTNFWRAVHSKVKQSTSITAVVDPVTGVLKCGIDEIKGEAENHLARVFHGSFEPVVDDGGGPFPVPAVHVLPQDHAYGMRLTPVLPAINTSTEIETDPKGWSDKDFTLAEVKKILKSLKSGKSAGWDSIPNEFLIHSPGSLADWLLVLFNSIKTSGVMPTGWNKGRITLIHKSGLRELLTNYRPITVIISLSGMFSKLLNSRLSELVEVHNLLGEVQNGFRRERSMTDNSFILDSILMMTKAKKQKLHLCYLDISKAYDSVNRNILWSRLTAMGFGSSFLGCLKALYAGDSVDCVVNGISTRPVFLRRGLRQGCSLSPLLFALYISDIGSDLTRSQEGFSLGGVTFSGLLFADDIVLMSRTFLGLEALVTMVKRHCDDLRLIISESKSNIVTGDDVDHLVLLSEHNDVSLSLSKVLSYKYLGTETTLLMSTTGSKKQQRCLLTAKRYKFACFYVGRTGPDVVDTVLATWSNIAIPSMLSGCDVIPFSESTIQAIERIQSQLAKHALGVTQPTNNVCAQTELGLKPFRMLLYQRQLGFYVRVMNLPQGRWVRKVLLEHLTGDWNSPYIAYITKIRQELQLYSVPPTIHFLKLHLNLWFINWVNDVISGAALPYVSPVQKFARARYVMEHDGCSTIVSYKFSNAGLGNRAPRPGRRRVSLCTLCSAHLDELHVAFVCPVLEEFRHRSTDIATFTSFCRTRGILPRLSFKMYLAGLDWMGNLLPVKEFLMRGVILRSITKEWLGRT